MELLDGTAGVGGALVTKASPTATTGTSTVTTPALTAGTHKFTATYPGDANASASTSAVLTMTVSQAQSTTTLSGPASVVAGATATLTANVTGLAPFASTAMVNFMDGTTQVGSVALSKASQLGTTGSAIFTTTALTGGSHTLTAMYVGDTNTLGSTSTPVTVAVGQAQSVTTLTGPATASAGGTVALMATIQGLPATATTVPVSFYDGATLLGNVPLVRTGLAATGTASFTTAALTGGSHSLTAKFAGDANVAGSASTVVTVGVSASASATTLNGPASVVPGGTAMLTANVTGLAPFASTATVNFLDGTTLLGSAPLTKDAAALTGSASFTTPALAGGTHTLTAMYVGDGNSSGSTSAPLTVITTTVQSATTLAGPATAAVGGTVALMATIQGLPSTATAVPVGFYDGATLLGNVPLVRAGLAATGTASFTTGALTGGTHSLTAKFAGDGNVAGSGSAVLMVVVSPSASVTMLSGPASVAGGGTATLTANVTGLAPFATTAMVNFRDGTTLLGSVALTKDPAASTGSAIFTTTALTGGTHTLTAMYVGDGNSSGSTSNPLTVITTTVQSATTLVGPATAVAGATAALTATVSGLPTSATTAPVSFYDGATLLGNVPLTRNGLAATGTASYTTGALTGGTHSLTAKFAGDTNVAGSGSTTLTVAVSASVSATMLTGPASVPGGGTAMLTANVTGLAPFASAAVVNFLDGTTLLGSATLTKDPAASTGSASFTTPALAGGAHNLTAMYAGDGNSSGSTSAPLTVTATSAQSVTMLAAPANAVAGATVALTATVSGLPASATSAMVSFYDGLTLLGNVPLTRAGLAATGTANWMTGVLTAGPHSLTAKFAGDGNVGASSSTVLVLAVSQAASMTTLTGPASVANQATATLTATVSGLPGIATTAGVNFFDGTTLLGTATLNRTGLAATGTASFTTAALTTGTHSLTAMFAGDGNASASTSPALAVVALPTPTVTLTTASSTLGFSAGASAGNSDVLTLTSAGGYTGSVTLSCAVSFSGTATPTLPPTCAFSNPTVGLAAGASGTSTLTISTTVPHAVGTGQQQALNRMGGRGAAVVAFALLVACVPRRRSAWRAMRASAMLVAATGLMMLAGCAAGSSSPAVTTPTTPVTPVGTTTGAYMVTITANGGSAATTAVTTVTVNVQ